MISIPSMGTAAAGRLMATGRQLALAVCVMALTLGWPGHAVAHSALASASPAPNSTAEQAPPTVRLTFTKAVEAAFSSIKVVDDSGKQVDKGDTQVIGSDAKIMEVGLRRLTTGTYKVIWTIVARDGHKASGEYTFSIM